MMFTEQIVIIIIFLMALTLNLVAEARKDENLRFYSKPLLIPLLLAYYLIISPRVDALVAAALLFAFVGDILLLFQEKKAFFIKGAVFFMLGHVSYTVFMGLQIDWSSIPPMHLIMILLPALFPAAISYYLLRSHFQGYQAMVIVYMISGTALLYFCLLRFCCFSGAAVWFPLLGTLVFLLSDSLIAWTRFKKNFKGSGVWIMLTYVIAECLIVLGLMQ